MRTENLTWKLSVYTQCAATDTTSGECQHIQLPAESPCTAKFLCSQYSETSSNNSASDNTALFIDLLVYYLCLFDAGILGPVNGLWERIAYYPMFLSLLHSTITG